MSQVFRGLLHSHIIKTTWKVIWTFSNRLHLYPDNLFFFFLLFEVKHSWTLIYLLFQCRGLEPQAQRYFCITMMLLLPSQFLRNDRSVANKIPVTNLPIIFSTYSSGLCLTYSGRRHKHRWLDSEISQRDRGYSHFHYLLLHLTAFLKQNHLGWGRFEVKI